MLSLKKNLFKVLFFLCLLLLTSCDNNEKLVKKFFKRLNAREVNAASSYIYPEDHPYLYVFSEQFLKNNKVTDFELTGINLYEKTDTPYIVVNLRCNNCSEPLKKFFEENFQMKPENITDTIFIKTVDGNNCLSFRWKAKNCPPHLKKATVRNGPLNVRCGPGKEFAVVTTLQVNDDILVDDSYNNPLWRKCILFEKEGAMKFGYIASRLSDIKEISFFTLGWFEKVGLLLASLIALFVLFIVFILLLTTIFRSGSDNSNFGCILFGVLILIVILTYQIIEGVVFELFMINLPY